MTWFHNRRILSKLMVLVAFMGCLIVLMGMIGIHSLKRLDAIAQDMEEAAQEALISSSLLQNVLSIDKLKFHIAADPSPENVSKAVAELENEKKVFLAQIATLEKSAEEKQTQDLEKIKQGYEHYITALEETVRAAGELKNFVQNEEQARVKQAAHRSDDESDALNTIVMAYSNESSKLVSSLSDDISTIYEQITRLVLICLVGGIFGGWLIGFLLAKYGIANPITHMVGKLQQLANEEFDIDLNGAERKDEVGDIARTAEVFKLNGLEKRRLLEEQKENELRAAQEKRAMMQRLVQDFEHNVQGIIHSVAAAATQLYTTAEGMKTTVNDVTGQSSEAAAASEETSSNVQSVAAAVEEMSAAVAEIASQVAQSSQLVTDTVYKAQEADKTTQLLAEAVTQITGILALIQSIAGQINLLALNATIESARAGEAGRGFAVVASEVKNLATQTGRATEEITSQIQSVQRASQEVIGALSSIQESVRSVNQYSSGIASAVEEQSAATKEITKNMAHAAKGVQHISDNVSAITRGAGDADRASAEVLSAAEMLSRQSELLNMQVKNFLSGMAA